MVVREDDSRRVVMKRGFHDLARINAGLSQRAAKKLFGREQAILRVEKQRHEHLVCAAAQRELQEVADRTW